MIDRRSGKDRRDIPRFKTEIEIEWEAKVGRKKGTVSDFNRRGCFVLCSGEAEKGEIVKIFLPLTDGRKLMLTGEVTNFAGEIGIAVTFINLTEAQTEFLKNFEKTLEEDED